MRVSASHCANNATRSKKPRQEIVPGHYFSAFDGYADTVNALLTCCYVPLSITLFYLFGDL
jgi:hypothetical protein